VRSSFSPLLLSGLLLVGCARSTPPLSGPGLAVVPMTELPPPRPDLAPGEARTYRLGAFDKIEVDVFGVDELSRREIQADASGHVAFPLVGTIDANGLTPEQLAAEIAARLRRFVRDPQVTVNLKESVSQVVTVDGQVREPGMYPVLGNMTLMRAVASARGLTEFARLSEVVVFRQVGDQRMAALYNLSAIRNGQYADPEIFANDVVVVGDSPARRMFRDILQAAPLLTTPIVALLQNSN
jgi:polysaccharide biosynthesis/export protein